MECDMTKGSPLRLILMFTLPLFVGNVFQQLYIVVDTAVVGRFVGVEALASVGAADWLAKFERDLAVGEGGDFAVAEFFA